MNIASQLIFFSIMGAVVMGILFVFPEPHKVLLGLAVAITPWQGGLWIGPLKLDFRFSYILFCLVAALLLLRTNRRSFFKRLEPSILLPTFGFVASSVIAAFGAVDSPSAWGGVVMLCIDYIIFFTVVDAIQKPSDLKYIFYPLMASLIFQSVLGLIQFKFSHFQLGIIDQSQSLMWWRAKGTFFHSNQFGMFLILTIPLIFRLFLLHDIRKNKLLKIFYSAAFTLGAVALIASQNRGSWVGITVAIVLVLFYEILQNRSRMLHKFIKLTIPIMIFFFLLSLRFGDFLLNRIFHDDATLQYQGRLSLQNEAMGLIRANPLGVGIGNYKKYISHEFVHNLFLLIASEAGIASLVFFIWILIVIFIRIIHCTRRSIISINNLGIGILVSFFAFLFASTAGPDYWIDYSVAMSFWILAGLVVVLNRLADRIEQSRTAMRPSLKPRNVV